MIPDLLISGVEALNYSGDTVTLLYENNGVNTFTAMAAMYAGVANGTNAEGKKQPPGVYFTGAGELWKLSVRSFSPATKD